MTSKKTLGVTLSTLILVGCLASCASGQEDISFVGTWQVRDDPSDIRYINDDGTCENWIEIDTGGTMACHIAAKPDESGEYTMRAEQTGNLRVYHLKPITSDEVAVRSSSNDFTMERQ